ncbi:MAG TPA: glycosyltransferase [Flavobacteriaceae bacterium]|nr:glycosyltransferase [Flavobacteriaceae bacterium]
MNRISVIIPMLNEAENIGRLLQHLIDNTQYKNKLEIIVVDGGSTDNSVEIVEKFNQKNFKLINSAKGRAKQMNIGAKAATGTILYFLHADSFPPKHFDYFILNTIHKGNNAGCFRLKFDSNHWWLRLAGWLTQFNFKACRGGDQSLFITKDLFNKIGGYDESYIIYEDNIFISKLYKLKQFTVINKPIITSARLYKKHGVFKLQFYFWMIYLKKWFGASASDLFEYYKRKIG